MPQGTSGSFKNKKALAVPNAGKNKKAQKQDALKKKASQSKPKPAKNHQANQVKRQIQKAINANIELTCKQRASNEFSAFKDIRTGLKVREQLHKSILKNEVIAAGKEVKKGQK